MMASHGWRDGAVFWQPFLDPISRLKLYFPPDNFVFVSMLLRKDDLTYHLGRFLKKITLRAHQLDLCAVIAAVHSYMSGGIR
jgi:hypothetical protein